jgi:hypothetical protein
MLPIVRSVPNVYKSVPECVLIIQNVASYAKTCHITTLYALAHCDITSFLTLKYLENAVFFEN